MSVSCPRYSFFFRRRNGRILHQISQQSHFRKSGAKLIMQILCHPGPFRFHNPPLFHEVALFNLLLELHGALLNGSPQQCYPNHRHSQPDGQYSNDRNGMPDGPPGRLSQNHHVGGIVQQ